MKMILKELVSLVLKEELNKSALVENDSQDFIKSSEDMHAYLQGKAMELEGLRNMLDGTSLALIKQEAKNIASDIAAELKQNLYKVPDFLSKSKVESIKSLDSIESLIDNLKTTYSLKDSFEKG